MNIKIIEPTFMAREIRKVTSYEKIFLNILEDDAYFETKVLSARKMLGIPENGFDIQINVLSKDFLSDVLMSERGKPLMELLKHTGLSRQKHERLLRKLTQEICNEYQMHLGRWEFPISLLIIYNKLIMYTGTNLPKVNLVSGSEVSGKTPYRYQIPDSFVYLEIEDILTKTELIRSVKKLWPKINKMLKKYRSPITSVPRIKIQDPTLEIYRFIFQQRQNEDATFTQIADKISDKYNKQFSDNQANIYFTRYLETINSLRKSTTSQT
ncbi:hypothetical protein A3K29_00795 [Candidatus Collierbacteria bacterium RIFOXYB2_FULL_46_14]|uniref:Uncharacterized protein n=1 Tax=Candidatus Collierbacteria bacterium GW2011_GWA2_46_26 TaxID=1618381 RepID=A0A0G1RTG7_9BACT|nr:MAG: hypothetical protein UW29_C0008G0055 [Candidatus Collierbacteria bacterium GW2011_GWC2_44_13]KKU33253.1 MAG: hypothetical protein UX47_C0005G0055 [Candidatus Collierbacteria bacterium GW2011_GWA2_46_26]OGD72675.1 MAG: hypothetical protein A3K29_00795 [Candidatus Collierbacteria bacterium RIFOXYB2_FULL_46_14]OGD75717.1 MAG: hypothetical protein A3K43_00795 [Candidatus Collierbacteria bacterium RIFOXYA2_FULL_46_20]OGD77053.1 MAG: hypothetical protein A3K39_00795 [Candidatus Collierbacteri